MCFSKLKRTIKTDWEEYPGLDKIRLFGAIAFLIGSMYIFITLSYPIIEGYNQIEQLSPEPRTFELPLRINLNGTRSFDVDVSFSLNFTYPNGTLIIDEPIDINSRAVFHTKNAENIETIRLGFQNCLLYNRHSNSIVPDRWGIPASAYLFFNSTKGGIFYPHVWTEEISVIWTIDGSYHPIVAITYKDETEPSVMLINDVTITVYPKEQLTQIQTNEVNTRLSFAVFVLSIFNIITIVIDVLPKDKAQVIIQSQESVDQQPQKEPENTKADKEEPKEQLQDNTQEQLTDEKK